MNDMDTFVDTVEKTQREKELKQERDKLNNVVEDLATTMKNDEISAIIRRNSRRKAIVKKQREENRRKFTIGFVSGTLVVTLLLAGVKVTKEMANKIKKNLAVREATVRLENEFINRAVENGLGVINEDGKLDTYSAINLDGADYTVVYTARNVLTPEDYNASIQTISTLDGSGKYIDYQQKLRDIGAIDPETGTASTAVEKQMVNDKLYTIYENESYSEVLNTCTDLENKTQGRGY